MTTTLKPQYASSAIITCTLAPLPNSAYRQSTAVDNTSNLYDDAIVQVNVKTNAAGVSATGSFSVYVYASSDSGTTYGPTGVTGTDGTLTPTNQGDLILAGTWAATAVATTYKSGPIYVARLFGGYALPGKWGIIVLNNTGAALDATEGNHLKQYQGLNLQNV